MLFGRRKRRIVRVLIVEDEPLVAFDTEHFLSDEGFEIRRDGRSGEPSDARDLDDRETEIDLVLVDVSLADGSGIDVAQAAHRKRDCRRCSSPANAPVTRGSSPPVASPSPMRSAICSRRSHAIEAVLEGRKPKRLPGGFNLFRAGGVSRRIAARRT